MKNVLYLLAFIFILLGIYFLFFPDQKVTADMHRVKPDMAVSAAELYADFRENEAAANEKYLNKTVVVQGEVIAISEGMNGMPRLQLYSKGDSFGVQCLLDKESKHRRQEFLPGEIIRLKCICMDYFSGVELTNCVETD